METGRLMSNPSFIIYWLTHWAGQTYVLLHSLQYTSSWDILGDPGRSFMRTPASMLLSALPDLGLIQTVSIQIVPITGSQTSLLLNVKRCLLVQCTWLGQPNPSQPSWFFKLNCISSLPWWCQSLLSLEPSSGLCCRGGGDESPEDRFQRPWAQLCRYWFKY